MKRILLFLFVIVAFSCKKDDPKPDPVYGTLKVVFKTADPEGMDLFLNVQMSSLSKVYVDQKTTQQEYTFTESVETNQKVSATISQYTTDPFVTGKLATLIIIFNNDTLCNKSALKGVSCSVDI
jgi:hypothetical protein